MASLPPIAGARILTFRAGALGDTLVALPSLAALRRGVGRDGAVAFVGSGPAIGLAQSDRYASEVHSFDRGLFRSLFAESTSAAELTELVRRFDLVVAWSRLPRLGATLEPLGIPSLTASPRPPEGVHASDHLLATLAPLGVGSPPADAPEIAPSAWHLERGRAFLRAHHLLERPFVAIHPGSGSPGKNWPLPRFEAVARLASPSSDVLWIAGEAESERLPALVERFPAPVARELELHTLAAVLSLAALFVGNDSGVSHLAAAAGAPTLAIFRASDPRQWSPRGRLVRVVDWRTSPDTVWDFAREMISGR